MVKPRYLFELKAKISEDYLSGNISGRQLSNKYGINARTIWEWHNDIKNTG